MAGHEQGKANIQEKNSQDAYCLWFFSNKQEKVKKYPNRDSALPKRS